jgi:hypothetical protein
MDSIDNIPLHEKLKLESEFKAKITEVIKGSLGLVYIFDHGQHVFPKFIAAKTFNPKKVERFGIQAALKILRREAKNGTIMVAIHSYYVHFTSKWSHLGHIL